MAMTRANMSKQTTGFPDLTGDGKVKEDILKGLGKRI